MKFRDFHRNVKIRFYLSFLSGTANNMVLPFMSIYFSGKLGDTTAGLAVIAGILAGLAAGIWGGYYADRIGRKKLMLTAEAGCTAAFAAMAMSNSPWFESPVVTFAMMILVSMLWGLHAPANDAMLLDVTEPESRKYMYAFKYWINNLSLAVAGIAGAFLFKSYLFELFVLLTCIGLITLLVTYFFIEEVYVPFKEADAQGGERPKAMSLWANYAQVMKDSTFMIFTVACLLLVSVEFHTGNYVAVRLGKEMMDAPFIDWGTISLHVDGLQMVGFLRTENTVLVVLLSAAARFVIGRFPDKKVLFVGYTLYIAGYSYVVYSNQPWLLLLSMLIATCGELMYVPVNQAYLGNMAPEHARSSYMAVNGMLYKIALLIGGGGVILGSILPSWTMAVLIGLTGVAGMLLFYSIVHRLDRRKENGRSPRNAAAAST